MSTTLLEDAEGQEQVLDFEPEQDTPPASRSTPAVWGSFFAGLGSGALPTA